MNINKKRISIVLGLVVILAIVIMLGSYVLSDRNGPDITIPDTLVYKDGISNEELLAGVSASDRQDGDVSDSLIVAKVIILKDDRHAKITYAATDRDNHVSEKSVIVEYIHNNGVEEETTYQEEESITDSSDETETETEAEKLSEETTAQAPEETTPIPTKTPEAPVLYLTTTEVTIKKGSDVKWVSYVDNIVDDKDERNMLYQNIMINNYADVNTIGDYEMNFSCVDSDKNRSPVMKLLVHIVE